MRAGAAVALPGELLIKVRACGVCRTDLHIVDGELPDVEVPLIPGHEIVGVVEQVGDGVTASGRRSRRHSVARLRVRPVRASAERPRESLSRRALHRLSRDGGYADYTVVDAGYTFKLPEAYSDVDAAPLLCAGLIGYRAYRMAGEGRRLGTVRLRRGGAHHRAGRRCTRARSVRVHVARRRRGAGIRAERAASPGPADRTSRRPNRSTRRSSSRRSAHSFRKRCRTSDPAASSSAPAFT